MRFKVILATFLFSTFALAGGPADSKGILVISYDVAKKECQPVPTLSVIFRTGSFPFSKIVSQIENVSDVSESESEVRLRLQGWVGRVDNYREADLLIRGKPDVLSKWRNDNSIGNRFIRITTDAKCTHAAASVDSLEYIYNWN